MGTKQLADISSVVGDKIMDYMAIISGGVYPTSATASQRAAFAMSQGLLGVLPESTIVESIFNTILKIGRTGISMTKGLFRIGK